MRSVLILTISALAVAPALGADRKRIDAAIKKGGEYLQAKHAPAANYDGGANKAGSAALAGLGMLEAGVKPDDPSVKNVAAFLRGVALSQTETYHTSLCILFLDRLGDPADVPTIQMLGVRLYAGITPNGGWTYQTWEPIPDAEAQRLRAALAKDGPTTKPGAKKDDRTGKDDGFLQPADDAKPGGKLHPEVARTFAAVKEVIAARGRTGAGGVSGDDNSNTQFGIIGLWVAARNGLPAKDAFALIENRFLSTQSRADGGWGYQTTNSSSTVAMTCAGLIGLAVGGAAKEMAKKPVVESKEKKEAGENDPFFNPKGADGEKPAPAGRAKGNTVRDKAAEAALLTVGAFLNGQQRGGSGLNNFVGAGNALYMLWSIERMAVAYSLDTVGGIDWYDWGADKILAMQQAGGAISDGAYGDDVNTAFAVLFLAKANFTKDLSAKNKGKDPGKVELRGGGGSKPPLEAPQKANDNKAARGGGTGSGVQDPARPGGFSLPKMEQPTEQGEADKVAKALTAAATDADFTAKLTEARDTKGAKWTKGLVLAAARLDGDKRVKAREALADRLVRMTAKTLREMLQDPEAELRRAACLACAMRDEKEFIPDLIERITDPSDLVVRAAKAGLVSFANTDFGPKTGADADAKAKAAAAWSAWHEAKNGKK